MADLFLIGSFRNSTAASLGPEGRYYQDNVVEVYVWGGDLNILEGEAGEFDAQFAGKVFRVMDDQLFVVHPGPPPGDPSR